MVDNLKIKRNPQRYPQKMVDKAVDNVDNFYLTRFSPIKTTFPAPIVINK